MSLLGRAENPYPPGYVLLDGVAFPSSNANTSPITVTYNRRLRPKTTISFQTDVDETPDVTTNYYINCGPPSFMVETDLGTGTSGTFNFLFAGFNRVEIYAKAGGRTSNKIVWNCISGTGADGVSAAGSMPTLYITPPAIQPLVGAGGAIPTLDILITQTPSPQPSGAIGTLTLTAPTGGLSAGILGDIGTLAIIPVSGAISTSASLSGVIGSVTITPPTGLEEYGANQSGSIGTLTLSSISGVVEIPANLSGSVGTITLSAPTGTENVDANANGSIGTLTITGVSGATQITPTIVQSAYKDGNTIDPTITLGSAPTVGNIIIACYFPNGAVNNPNTAYWTEIARDGSPPKAVLYYHYVQGGDTALLGAFESPAATSSQAAVAWEVHGVSATWASTLDFTQFDYQGTGASSLTTTSNNTTRINELALIAFAEFV